jgi:glycosyltransferase involved in cell wall biosynthesis
MISICMITYNHEAFISEAIQSLLDQKTNHEFNIVIGDDFSTDDTYLICQKFKSEYPEKIILLDSTQNLGMMPNFVRTLKSCNHNYIAICDGDDYWTDSNKLDQQLQILEKQPEISLSCHNTTIIEGENEIDFCSNRIKDAQKDQIISTDQILGSDIRLFHTASLFFRKSVIDDLPEWFETCINGDFPLMVLCAMEGDVHYSASNSAIYRIHGSNVTNRAFTKKYLSKLYHMFNVIDTHSNKKFTKIIQIGKQGRKLHFLLNKLSNSTDRYSAVKIGLQALNIARNDFSINKRDVLYLTRKKLTSKSTS